MYINLLIILFVVFGEIYLFILLRKEKKRNRILASFMDGLIRYSVSLPYAVENMLEKKVKASELKAYEVLQDEIAHSFEKDFWVTPFESFIKNDRSLFWEGKLSNGGFNQTFLDFYDRQVKEWYAIKYRTQDSEEATPELGEELIYNDIMSNKLERLKDIRVGQNPRQFFKYLSEEKLANIETRLKR